MKKFYQSITAMLLIGFSVYGLNAQIPCKESFDLSLDAYTGTAALTFADIIIEDTPGIGVLELYPASFDCNDIHEPVVTTVSYLLDEILQTCTSSVIVIDDAEPWVVSEVSIDIIIPSGFSSMVINPQLLDDGSFDNCGNITMRVSPPEISCSDIGNVLNVRLIVEDESGNTNFTIIEVRVSGDLSPKINCTSDFELSLVNEFLVPLDLISNQDEECSYKVLEVFDDQNEVISDNLLTKTLIGETVKAVLTRPADNATCETYITVIESTCEEFYICDTECNNATIGNCDSGHATDDYVEWPCDLSIDEPYPGFSGSSPNNLVSIYNIQTLNAEPAIKEDECHKVSLAFEDHIFYIEGKVKVVRKWTIIEWNTFYFSHYTQEIFFNSVDAGLVWNICDTAPNGSPVGDCSSGHSLDDDIEWPDDVASFDARISPGELYNIAKADITDTKPVLVNNESAYSLNSYDYVITENKEEVILGRTWEVVSKFNPEYKANYIQKISVPISETIANEVRVSTVTGRPIPNVDVNGVLSNISGVSIVPENDLSLSYNDAELEGIDILDVVMMQDFILGNIQFTNKQNQASDLNANGIVSTLDFVLLMKKIAGLPNENIVNMGWSFSKQNLAPWNKSKAQYIGFKYGDVDDSATLTENASGLENSLVFEDQLINIGERYTIDLNMKEGLSLLAGQLFLNLNEDVSVKNVISQNLVSEVFWSQGEDGELRIVFSEVENLIVSGDESLITIEFVANRNTTLAEVLSFSDKNISQIIDGDRNRVIVNAEVQNEITSRNKDVFIIESVILKPNPAVSFVNIELNISSDFQVNVFNANGQKQMTSNSTKIDISTLGSGLYFIQGINDSKLFSGKFLKL